MAKEEAASAITKVHGRAPLGLLSQVSRKRMFESERSGTRARHVSYLPGGRDMTLDPAARSSAGSFLCSAPTFLSLR
jgi:hypothetical protein